MNLADMKALVHKHDDDIINKHDLSALDRDVAPDATDHAAAPGTPPGVEGARAWLKHLFTAFPDMSATIDDTIAEGDKVVIRKTWQGTHQGPFMGVEPTGKSVRFGGIVIWRIENGKLAERWAQIDRFSLLEQLGAITPPGGGTR